MRFLHAYSGGQAVGATELTVYYWLRAGEIAHQEPAIGAVCISSTADVGAVLRAWPAVARLISRSQPAATGGAT